MTTDASARHTLRAQPSAPAEARRWLRRAPLHLDEETNSDLMVIATELVTNAVRHADPLPGGVIELSYRLTPEAIAVSVTDGGSPHRPAVRSIDLSSPGGRGLYLVSQLADSWHTSTNVDGTHFIQATLRLSRPAATP
ncbi:ATP-binding protein [Salininema proteolyticum]|uniref:ATP-binding protein n=1 Tax=Salininema proteolyticum TaxID=1607685 RepID=A0ABV8TT73_9ACTN